VSIDECNRPLCENPHIEQDIRFGPYCRALERFRGGTVNSVRAAQLSRFAQVGRTLSAAIFSTIAFSAVTMSQAGASAPRLSCTAVVLRLPHPNSVVAISVSTRPHATVSGTETAGTYTWSMTPNAAANAAGRATLSQRVAVVRKDEIVRVTVQVTLDGTTGHCSTRYSPPTLVAQT
jgi:hypothetical protein